jgi:pimeloyl-ACP methyl ester carboxylesterase
MSAIANLLFKLLLGVVGTGVIAYLAICIVLRIGQQRLIFFPSRSLAYTPRQLGLAYQDVWLSVLTWTGKVERLHGWWIPAPAPTPPVLLYLHGNGGNIGSNLGPAQRFHQLGFSVFLVDYRGYGRSDGDFPTEAEVYRDAQAAWEYLVERRGIEPQHIFLYGHSLGGAIAIDLAIRQPKAAGVIVENTFTSLREMVDRQGIYRLFPADLLLTQRFDSRSKLKLLQIPLLVISGGEDGTVPATMSQELFEAAQVPKRRLLVPAASHNNVAVTDEGAYCQAVRDFYQLVRQTLRERQKISR